MKRILTGLTAAAMIFSGIIAHPEAYIFKSETTSAVVQESTNTSAERYFYSQLPSDSQKIYEAMENMYAQGIFKTGDGDYDLEANGFVTQLQIEQYAGGDMRLLTAMGEARDAFDADHPEIFYVDFSSLSLRATRDSSGKYHAYLGAGRRDNYFTDGFTSEEQVETAIEEQNEKISEIASAAKEYASGETTEIIKYVHDEIINTTSYRMEGVCDTGNEGFISTSYGSLVKGQAVCEGYSKAFKAVMDELDIPCITVQGIVRWSENVPQAHMWNYVQLDSDWYAVDATWDDPVDPSGNTDTQGIDGFENSEYLLASEPVMNKCHVTSGIMSAVGYEFTYPELSIEELGFNTVAADRGLTVKYNSNGEYNDLEAGVYKVSYNGMGYTQAAAEGKYILGRFYQYDAETDEYINGGWGYLDPEFYSYGSMIVDSDTEITISLPHIQYVEFAVTDLAPGDFWSDPQYLTYQGDPLLFLAESEKLFNETGDYVAPPYIESSTPTVTGRLHVGKTYPVTITYDEDLIQVSGQELSLEIESDGTTAVENSKIENLSWDGKRTITFDFTPSEMWSDDTVCYEIQPVGLVGKNSGKAPNSINYIVSHPCAAYAYKAQGYDWNVFGKPSLLENVDFDTTDWLTDDGSEITDELKDRLVLVTTKTTQSQDETMMDMIDSTFGEEILSSETYNINLTLCKSQVIRTGDGVRVSVGFPEGYSADDEGVEFKAYHFSKNEQGEITGVEEIECTVTKYGLIITCDSFSPFAIAAVKTETAEADKTVVLSCSSGGSLNGAESDIFTLSEGESITLTAKADAGYRIESISVGGIQRDIENSSEENFTVSYDELESVSELVEVSFIADSAAEKDEKRGETAVIPSGDSSYVAILWGDADLSGEVNVTDAVLIMSYVANPEKYPIDDAALPYCDVYANGDGINNMDALSVQKYAVQTVESLPE